MAWYGDRKEHSLCAKGIKTGRRVYHRPYVPGYTTKPGYIFQSSKRCPTCGTGMTAEGGGWYCINCNENWNPGRLEKFEAKNVQALKEANWILENLRKEEQKLSVGNTLAGLPNVESWEKWNTKWENWSRTYPDLIKVAKDKYGKPKKSLYDRKYIYKKQVIKREGHKIYV